MRIACDTHTHTIFSRHAYSTVEENVRAAAERGIELLGVTDHYSAMLRPDGAGGPDLRDYQEYLNFEVWPEVWHGVRLMHGCEADIVDFDGHLYGWDTPVSRSISGRPTEGEATLQELVLRDCDYVIASVHGTLDARASTRERATNLYLQALRHPKVLVLGHVGRSGLDFDVEAVAEEARDLGKLIEVNEASLYGRQDSTGRCLEVARCCKAVGCRVSTGSDAHISHDVGRFDRTRALLEGIDFPQRLVATSDAETFCGICWEVLG